MSEIGKEMAIEGIERAGAILTGNISQEQAFKLLAGRLAHAREKHPIFATDAEGAMDVIDDEFCALIQAVMGDEGQQRVIDEALDVAATAMRMVMGEVQV